jgi:hypothetical protein
MYCSPQSCTLPSRHTIVEAQAVRRLPAFCILRQVFLPQDCPVWPLHLWQCHLASRIWWQVLLGLQGVKTLQSHRPLPLLLVSCLVVCVLCVCHVAERRLWPRGLWPYLVLPHTFLIMSECTRTALGSCWEDYSRVLLLVCCSCAAKVCAFWRAVFQSLYLQMCQCLKFRMCEQNCHQCLFGLRITFP